MKTVNRRDFFNRRYKERGFTLIELMIVMVVIGILAALAIPSYQNYVRRTYRKEAMAALQGLAQSMERYYVQNGGITYADADTAQVPKFFAATAPIDGGTAHYNLRITSATATTYALQAQPVGAQASDGLIQLLSTGERSWDKDNDGTLSAAEKTWSDH